ncbi:hypothetical protein EDD15DRAFT_2195663 [Pisolithus albus]|nr:hypothetical protein EDD15DRAFT_2195663 [Pisolithus albus]
MHPEEYTSTIPRDWWMNLTSQVAEYMQNRFREEIFEGPCALPNTSIPVPLLCRADRVIAVIVQAYQHPVIVNTVRHGKTLDTVASLHYQEINIPTVVLNANGNVRLWYLPGAISHAYQKDIWNSLHSLRRPLTESLNRYRLRGWRNDRKLFHQAADLKGSLDLSPAWYQQGHGPPNFHPEVSKLLKSRNAHMGARGWVNDMSEFHSLLSGTLSVIHLRMYEAGREVLIRLNDLANRRDDADMRSILPIWSSVYNSMSIMVNRATPYHIDINGREPWLDMLVTVGEYQPLDFVIPTLELRLRYMPERTSVGWDDAN